MFTGIVEAVGQVVAVDEGEGSTRLVIEAVGIAAEMGIGASLAVDGACLTVVAAEGPRLEVEVVPETLERTTLGRLRVGDPVNLERAMEAAGRFEGHVVQGHVDGRGRVVSVAEEGDSRRMRIDVPERLLPYLVEKGSITIDGVSLTIARIAGKAIEVALIPHTLSATTLGGRAAGDEVNLEADILAKHVERLLQASGKLPDRR